MIRHYSLNENQMDGKLGYFVSDVERAGPYCMMAEARAMANGDPRYLGYLLSNTLARGFPEYVRAFNAAFLALPALPSTVAIGATADPEIVVRVIPASTHDTYVMAVNTGFTSKQDVSIRLPESGTVTNAATGRVLGPVSGLRLSFYPGQLYALHVR